MDTKIISKYGYKKIFIAFIFFLLSLVFDCFWILFGFIFLLLVLFYINPEREADFIDKLALYCPVDGIVKEISITNLNGKTYTKVIIKKTLFSPSLVRGLNNCEILDFMFKTGLDMCKNDSLNSRAIFECIGENGKFKMIFIGGALSNFIRFENFKNLNILKRFGFFPDGKVILVFENSISLKICLEDKVKAGQILGFYEV